MNSTPTSSARIRLRPFPYPFKAALAICSDIDECDLDSFIAIHRIINSKKYGFGLPVSDSFFAVAPDERHLAYFNFDGLPRAKEAEFIRQAIKDGLIDSLHSWGPFGQAPLTPLFLQDIARKLTHELVGADLQLPVWINHGNHNNHQNLFARLWPEFQGDDLLSPFYTMQCIRELGIKYYWWSEVVQWPLSSARQKISGRQIQRVALNYMKNMLKIISNNSAQIRTPESITRLTNKIVLRDGSPLIAFTRFARHPEKSELWRAGLNSLRHSLTKRILDELIQCKSYIIIYTHLGKGVVARAGKTVFPAEEEEALKLLANYYNQGLIWVAPTAKLLQYKTVYDYLEWDVIECAERIIIKITGVKDPVTGERVPEMEELEGICFYSPMPMKTSIYLLDREISVKKFKSGASDGGGWVGFASPAPPKTELIE